MDPSLTQSDPSVEEDEWDTDGFVIPSLAVGDSDIIDPDVSELKESQETKPPIQAIKEEEKIYLGPHGAPPSQSKHQELSSASRKQRFRHKLKDADRRYSGAGRENKVENLRELVCGKATTPTSSATAAMTKSSARDWLDPHCHESQFERYSQ